VDETDQAYGYTGGDPVVGTDPSGLSVVPGTGGGCISTQGFNFPLSSSNQCVSGRQLKALSDDQCGTVLAANGIQEQDAGGLCGPPTPSFEQLLQCRAESGLKYVMHQDLHELEQGTDAVYHAAKVSGCVIKTFSPTSIDSGSAITEGGLSAIGWGPYGFINGLIIMKEHPLGGGMIAAIGGITANVGVAVVVVGAFQLAAEC
jgi:hypothetical protein